ncbi:MAG: hypothetical protein IPP31_03990 [Chitinophagaceae bacterium]|nr:hypothetical protein [Chitinophagaceae bacterium]
MALVTKLVLGHKDRESIHKEVDCTCYIIETVNGKKILQLDTYGSDERKMPGKVSQSIQFSSEAIKQLKEILQRIS